MDKHEHQNIRLGIENASVGGLHGGDNLKYKEVVLVFLLLVLVFVFFGQPVA